MKIYCIGQLLYKYKFGMDILKLAIFKVDLGLKYIVLAMQIIYAQ